MNEVLSRDMNNRPRARNAKDPMNPFQRCSRADRAVRAYQPVKPVVRRTSMGFSAFLSGRSRKYPSNGTKVIEARREATSAQVMTMGRLWRNSPMVPVNIKNGMYAAIFVMVANMIATASFVGPSQAAITLG